MNKLKNKEANKVLEENGLYWKDIDNCYIVNADTSVMSHYHSANVEADQRLIAFILAEHFKLCSGYCTVHYRWRIWEDEYGERLAEDNKDLTTAIIEAVERLGE